MWNSIKRQFRVQRDDWVLDKFLIAGGTVFGVLLLWLITTLDSSVDTCFQVGTILSSFIAAVYLFANMASGMKTYFNMEIGMGSTRRRFIVSYFVVTAVNALAEVLVIAGLSVAEKWLYRIVYPTLLLEMDFTPYVLRWWMPAALVVIAVGGLWCALHMRFGRKIVWLGWVLWMFLCIGLPRIHSAYEETPNSLFGKIGSAMFGAIKAVPGSMWMGIAAVTTVIGVAGTYVLMRGQQVVE